MTFQKVMKAVCIPGGVTNRHREKIGFHPFPNKDALIYWVATHSLTIMVLDRVLKCFRFTGCFHKQNTHPCSQVMTLHIFVGF